MARELFLRQIELISIYGKRLQKVVGLDECTCDECSNRKREIAIILGEYGAEYATDLTVAALQEGVATRKLERKIDMVLEALDKQGTEPGHLPDIHTA